MASTDFKVVSWSPNDPITDDKLQQMNNNDSWLFNNLARAQYAGNGVTKAAGVKILSGLVTINPRPKSRSADVNVSFGSFFSQGCYPIVTTSTASAGQRMLWTTISGPGSALQPTQSGFQVHIYADTLSKKKAITSKLLVGWHALGW